MCYSGGREIKDGNVFLWMKDEQFIINIKEKGYLYLLY